MLIYKIVPRDLWSQVKAAGCLDGAPVDIADGFIHFSTASQVRETAARHFIGRHDLLLVAVESELLGSALRWETSRGGALFPHLHGPLWLRHVSWAIELALGPDARHVFPDDLA